MCRCRGARCHSTGTACSTTALADVSLLSSQIAAVLLSTTTFWRRIRLLGVRIALSVRVALQPTQGLSVLRPCGSTNIASSRSCCSELLAHSAYPPHSVACFPRGAHRSVSLAAHRQSGQLICRHQDQSSQRATHEI